MEKIKKNNSNMISFDEIFSFLNKVEWLLKLTFECFMFIVLLIM